MSFTHGDRVWDTTATTGTGTYSLAESPLTGFQAFASALSSGQKCYYCVSDGTDWEINEGTLTHGAPDTLTRDTLLDSSTGSAINWGAGDKDIFLVQPAKLFNLHANAAYFAVPATLPTAGAAASIAVGDDAQALETRTVAIGYQAQAGRSAGSSLEQYAVAIGGTAKAYELGSVALGYLSVAGKSGSSTDPYAIAIGYSADAPEIAAVAIGQSAQGAGNYSVALGSAAEALEQGTIAIGQNSQAGDTAGAATEYNAIAVGNGALAYETESIAIGGTATAGATSGSIRPYAIAVGYVASSTGEASIAIGKTSAAVNNFAVAVGETADANGVDTVAIGHDSEARDQYGVAIGYLARTGKTDNAVTAQSSVALGHSAKAYEIRTIAIGASASVGTTSGTASSQSIAIGANASSVFENTIATGYYATAVRDGEHCYSVDHASNNVHRRGSIGWAITTSDATATKLKIDLTGNTYFSTATASAVAFSALVIGYGASEHAAYKVEGAIKNVAGTVSWIGTPTITVLGETTASMGCAVALDTVNDGFEISVTGVAAQFMEWTADMRYAETLS